MDVPKPSASASPPWERWAVWLLLGLFLAVGVNNIINHAFAGQDFSFHVGCANHLLGRPDEWFAQDVTNRPLIYWIAIDGIFLTDNRAPFEFAAAVFVLLNAGALWLLHDSSRRLIADPALRIAALALIAFAPVTLITSVVFAADAMATPPFALLCWSLVRWDDAPPGRNRTMFAALAGAALCVGNFAKFTFILLPVGVAVVAWLAWRWGKAPLRCIAGLVVLVVVAPTGVGGWLHAKALRELRAIPPQHHFEWSGTGEMTWRSLLAPKLSDVRIFAAPGYWDSESEGGRKILPLLENNNYSYPALLHLGIFTDVLDFSHGGKFLSGTLRPQPQKTFSQWAVRLGVLFSLAGVLGLAAMTWRTLRGLGDSRQAPPFAFVIWFVLGATWFVPLVITLPLIQHAYDWGYWLPRLVVPGLWAFALGLFTWLDSFASGRTRWPQIIGGFVAAQTGLHLLSVWY